jgi:uncharacterized protein YdiU (UPF0061 family)
MFSMPADRFDNQFVRQLPGDPEKRNFIRQVTGACWSEAPPTPVASPRLIAHAPAVAELLDIQPEMVKSQEFAEAFAGNRLLPGMFPFAACYGGHQFGNWAGQLGDGRAISLGEFVNQRGERWELQLKGAGKTPYSRGADGRAVLRSSIREFLCSEAMHHLGVPTTRALSLVATGEPVLRDMFYDGRPRMEPGAIVCRVSPSFIRFGNFEIFAARGEVDILSKLVDFTIARDFPEISGDLNERRVKWFHSVCERTARLMVEWMRVGFVHGVMNTDNLSILGLTIDYGPYGWIDQYEMDWTPNTTDAERHRYAFGKQPNIALWNLACLANAVYGPIPSEDDLRAGLDLYQRVYADAFERMTAAKLGFPDPAPDALRLANELHQLMVQSEVDMTLLYRGLAKLDLTKPDFVQLHDVFYNERTRDHFAERWQAWLQDYAAQIAAHGVEAKDRVQRMNRTNPIYVLRNYLAQEAIDLAEKGDYSRIHQLQRVLADPYTERPEWHAFAQKRPEWAVNRAGCSMLSCSS